jgi:hypothetical protein
MYSGKLISINVYKGRNSWSFRDSNLLLPSSLRKLSKNLLEKDLKGIFPYYLKDINYSGEFPNYELFDKFKVSLEKYNQAKDEHKSIWNFKTESIKYCIQDSKILLEVLNSFNKFIFNKFQININNYPTIPSLAFAIFKIHYLKEGEVAKISGKIKKDIQLGYTGGSTDMFISKNIEGEKIYVYDVNSLYPFVMEKYEFPIGESNLLDFSEGGSDLNENLDLFGHFYCEVSAPDNLNYPILQLHYNKRTISPIGTFKGWFFSEELKNALKFGYKINLLYGYTFQKGRIFQGWVKDQYSLRTSYPKSHPMNFIAKLLLNSLYGRFGMTDIFPDILLLDQEEFMNIDYNNSDVIDQIQFGNKYLVKFGRKQTLKQELSGNKEVEGLSNVNIAIACAITAYARIHMSQFKDPNFLKKHNLKLFYSDTDSAYFNGPLPINFISETILGAMKLEGVYNEAVFLAPKVYGLRNKDSDEEIVKIKGLSKESIKHNGINTDTLIQVLNKNYPNPEIPQFKWFKNLELGEINVKDQLYTLKITNSKRKMLLDKDGVFIDTIPYILNNGKLL